MEMENLIREDKGTIIDVRNRHEFSSGHVEGSENIPLNEISGRLEELKQLPGPLVLCCASGMRSGQVERFLKENNIPCVNAGSWMDVNYIKHS
ncbi:Rhodanese-like domain-containing protein [Zhouia amylolytica]|uniref:Rhodanese-related sulfurtransferase n=2 Tax=Zhouia amylolytica TaxID=376730 RepID=W2URX6_9FLAO|nr:rhodanese-like domain-containing protein [Zhouia amylolytica]ETN96226.1 rhodanese-related sulfurtransferase [Zhouia amylolytica AD3]MCQ0112598.1 rhodanese-like domain-containing protein [Zhouia amylolytica]SFS83456.1 Rhodanese-like domain-containing protein [Zhouia amylolytica]